MSSVRYALLTLLAREPLSGYDIKLQMNNRIGPFWKVGSNQVYPELSKLETEGLIKLQGVEHHTYRPARKLYEITENGREALIRWTIEPGELENTRDDFLLMADLSDAFISLPGGLGTYEELFEAACWSQIGIHQKPIGLLNVRGFYNPLLDMLRHTVREGFMKEQNLALFIVESEPELLLDRLTEYTPVAQGEKWVELASEGRA